MRLIKNNYIDYEKIIVAWQPFYKDPLTKEDAYEITTNIYNLANLFLKWEEKEKAKKDMDKQCKGA